MNIELTEREQFLIKFAIQSKLSWYEEELIKTKDIKRKHSIEDMTNEFYNLLDHLTLCIKEH